VANGVQLATAYVSVNINTDDLGKQIKRTFTSMERQGAATGTKIGQNMSRGVRSSFSRGGVSMFRPMEIAGVRWAAKAGVTIGSVMKKALMGAAGLTGVGSIFAVGGVLSAGLERLKTLQRAEVQLSLKLSPQEIQNVRKAVEDAVTGTPISLDAAMRAAPRLVNAGLSTDEIQQYTRDVANLAAATGGLADFERLDIILSQVRDKTKLTGEEMMQLIDAGVDIRGMLKETFGWDDKTLENNLKRNQVGLKEIQKATQNLYGRDGGLAKRMGETFEGATKNLAASVARLGANFIAALTGKEAGDDPLKDFALAIGDITDKVDDMGQWVKDNREEIRGFFTGARDAAVGLGSAIGDVVDWFKKVWQGAQNLGTQIASAFERGTSAVQRMWSKVTETFDGIRDKLSEIVTGVKEKFEDIFGEDGWFARQFKRLGELVDKVRDVLGLGPATANAAAPGGGTTPFNPGPMAPAVAAGQAPLGGSTMGLSSVPAFGFDENGNPLVSGSGSNFNPGPMKYDDALAQANAQDAAKPRKVGSDAGLLPETVALKDFLAGQFPEITDIGGYRDTDITPWGVIGEHASGKAIDIMVPKDFMDPNTGRPTAEGLAWGDRVMKAALAKGASVLWKQTQFDPDGSASPMGDRGNPTQNHWDHLHVLQGSYANYASGGKVYGPGTGTSDSIPAMLSNGEHVLTAKDVSAMGGQDSVYAFRAALQAGMIPGFQTGGAVDPQIVQDATDNVADLNKQYEIAAQRQREVLANPDASDGDRLQAEISAAQAWRAARQAEADLPIIQSGGTPPDRTQQNALQAAEDELRLSQQALADLNTQDGVPYSQRLSANARVGQAVRERDQLLSADQGGTDYLAEFARTAGFSPTAAANTGVAGTSSLAAVFSSANEVVGGLIDTGASLAQTAVSAAITAGAAAGTFGAGAAAAPAASGAASYGIQLGAAVGKRLSAFGFQLGAIGADSLVAQAMPFGAPRWLGYDYTNFAPQLGIQQAALTTLEKAGTDAINARFGTQDGGVPPQPAMQAPGAEPVATPESAPQPSQPGTMLSQGDPGFYTPPEMPMWPFNPNGAGGGGGGGSWAQGGAVKVYDEGGVLKPGDLALNASTRPEKILTQKQWDSLAKLSPSGNSGPMVKIDAIYGLSPEDVASQIESKQKLAMMRYAGRP